MPDSYICEITDRKELAGMTYAITVKNSSLASEICAGQFLHIRCGEARLLRRPFGVCSVRNGSLRFVFEVKGEGTRWLSEREPGAILDILGPLGNGFRIPDGNIAVIGGGLGTPPMLFAAESARGKVTAVLGFRDMSRVILADEFKSVCDEVYLTTDDGSAGICGTVAIPLEELLAKGGFDAALSCGQFAMQRAVAHICGQYGVPCQVSLEERLGCGVGACLVCACETHEDGKRNMRRVCKDGPVFEAEKVVWQI